MVTAITGGTGFIGRHVAEALGEENTVILSRRTGTGLDDVDVLTKAFQGCDTVVHAAGINREIGDQTFQRVHVEGTLNVVEAAKRAGVEKIIMLSFLKARPNCGSGYHETKWVAEQMIRFSGLEYTILKSGMVYGKGDHMIDHISHALHTFPVFGTVGVTGDVASKTIRPIPVEELVTVITAAVDGRLTNQTVEVVGGEELLLSEAVRRISRVVGKTPPIIPLPVLFHKGLSQLSEWTMKVPLVAKTQLRMLTEGISEAYEAEQLPDDLKPHLMFSDDLIRASLPNAGPFTVKDLRFSI